MFCELKFKNFSNFNLDFDCGVVLFIGNCQIASIFPYKTKNISFLINNLSFQMFLHNLYINKVPKLLP